METSVRKMEKDWVQRNLVWLLVILLIVQTGINVVLFRMISIQQERIIGLNKTIQWLLEILGFKGLWSM